jgi:hypothetical protein
MGKKSGSGSGKNDPDHTVFPRAQKPLKYLNSLMRIRDPGWKKFGSGIRDGKPDPESGENIPDPQHCLAVSMRSVLMNVNLKIPYVFAGGRVERCIGGPRSGH